MAKRFIPRISLQGTRAPTLPLPPRPRLGPNPSFSVSWKGPSFRAGPPIVARGAVWVLDVDSGNLNAFNATDGQAIFSHSVGSTVRFATPSEGDGRVFVAAGTRILSFILA